MNSKRKNLIFKTVSLIVLLSFTVYFVLDTFVIAQVYSVVESESSSSSSSTSTSSDTSDSSDSDTESTSEAVVVTETSYSDENITITITEYREYDTTIYVADIVVSSAEYLQTAFAQSSYGKNVSDVTSSIAEGVDAILAINGDNYGSQTSGYVIRDGVIYRDVAEADQEDLVIYEDGTYEIINESDITADELLANGAVNVLSFGPGLVSDSTVTVDENDEVDKAMTSNPRTAIGQIDDLHYVMVVSDGRTDESTGLTLYQLADFMTELGCTTAYNLDGGGSSTMYFMGEVVNNPTTNGNTISERSVTDIVYIGY